MSLIEDLNAETMARELEEMVDDYLLAGVPHGLILDALKAELEALELSIKEEAGRGEESEAQIDP